MFLFGLDALIGVFYWESEALAALVWIGEMSSVINVSYFPGSTKHASFSSPHPDILQPSQHHVSPIVAATIRFENFLE